MRRFNHGYTLPSVMILSVVMFALLTVSLQLVGATSTALRDQYYEQLSREASEAGIAHAEACIRQNGVAGWNNDKPLKPSTDCSGNTVLGLDDFVSKQGHFQATYSIGAITGTPGNHKYTVNSQTNLASGSGDIYKSLSSSATYDSHNSATPEITGGAGWGQGPGHINIYKSINGEIYGFGENGSGQINNSKSPTAVKTPEKMTLPTGVSSVTDVQTSGQGASFLCIIGNDQQAYCRGEGLGLNPKNAWTKVGFAGNPENMKVYELTLNGYGPDYFCVLAGTSSASRQAYCAGTNDYGIFGDGVPNPMVAGEEVPREVPISSMVKFKLPAGLTVKSTEKNPIASKSSNTCVLASDDNLYCSGNSDDGQIAGTYQENNYTPKQYQIPRRGSVDRKAKEVFLSPHSSSSTIMVLATDGTMWVAGNKEWGSFGTSEESGVTGSDGAKLWGSSNTNWDGDNATGGSIKASSGKCLDNNNNSLSNGNKVQIWSCDTGTSAQKWFLLDNGDGTSSIWLPGRRGTSTNYCLDLNGGIAENGRSVALYYCNGSDAQKWTLDSVDGSVFIKSRVNSSYCLDIPGGSSTNGVAIQLYGCNGSNAQKFTIDSRANPWQNGIALNRTYCGLRDDEYGGVWCAGKNYNPAPPENYWADYNYCTASANPRILRNDVGGMPPGTKIDLSKFSDEWKYQIDSLMFIATDGQVYGAGRNVYGKLGNDGVGGSAYNYMQCAFRKFILPPGVTATDISARDEFSTFVLGANGRIYASGLNGVGQLGNNSITNVSKPVESAIPPGMGYSY